MRSTIEAGIQQGQRPYSQTENGTPILFYVHQLLSYFMKISYLINNGKHQMTLLLIYARP